MGVSVVFNDASGRVSLPARSQVANLPVLIPVAERRGPVAGKALSHEEGVSGGPRGLLRLGGASRVSAQGLEDGGIQGAALLLGGEGVRAHVADIGSDGFAH